MTNNIKLSNEFIYDSECYSEFSRHFAILTRKIELAKANDYHGIKLTNLFITQNSPYIEINYNDLIFQITITKIKDKFYWYLKPYKATYFTYPSQDIDSFDIIIQAIKKHAEIALKKA